MKLNGDTIKEFFINHMEKIGFGIAVLLVGLFIYNGMQLKGYDRTPDQLRSQAQAAQTTIASYKWEAKRDAEELDPNRNFSSEVAESTKAIASAGYPTPVPWVPTSQNDIIQRPDPEILAASDLEADVLVGPLLVVGAPNPFASLEAAPRPKAKELPRRPPPKKKNTKRGGGGSMGGMEGMGGMMGSGAEEDGGGMESSLGGMEGMGGSGAEGMEGGMMGGGMMGGSGPRKLKNLPKHWISTDATANAPGMMEGGGAAAAGQAGVVGRVIVAVKALVPYEDQIAEFERSLLGTTGADESRDFPKYLSFFVQRAEVGADPNQLNWQLISSKPVANAELAKFKGRGRELVDPSYCLPNLLTMEMPPILMRSIDDFGMHSKVPTKAASQHSGSTDPNTPEPNTPLDPSNPLGPLGPIGSPVAGGSSSGSGSMGGMEGSGAGLPSMGGSMGGMGGMSGSGMGGMSGSGEGMEGSMGMDGGGGPTSASAIPKTKFKLLRFFDLTAEPGKKYRYRFQLIIADPNNPQTGALNKRILKPEVLERLKTVKAEEAKVQYKIFFRYSDWSEPSPVVSTPSHAGLLAGPGEVLDTIKVSTTGALLPKTSPVAKAAAYKWGGARMPTDLSYSADVTLGSVLNKTGDLTILTPDTHELRLAKGVDFQTDTIVVDIQAARNLGDDKDNPVPSNVTMAMVDSQGRLVIRDEADDVEKFRIYSFAEDQPAPATPSGGTGGGIPGFEGGEGMEGGLGGIGGMFGGEEGE